MPPKDRFIAIASIVDGKSPKECLTRFKELCAKVKAEAEEKKALEAAASSITIEAPVKSGFVTHSKTPAKGKGKGKGKKWARL